MRHARFVGAPAGAAELGFEEDLARRGARRLARAGRVDNAVRRDLAGRVRASRGRRRPRRSPDRRPLRFPAPGLLAPFPRSRSWRASRPDRPPGRRRPGAAATDATGTGAYQGSIAVALEQGFGAVLVNVTGTVGLALGPHGGKVCEQPGLEFAAYAAVGYRSATAGARVHGRVQVELDASIDGDGIVDSGRACTRLGLAGGYGFSEAWRNAGDRLRRSCRSAIWGETSRAGRASPRR